MNRHVRGALCALWLLLLFPIASGLFSLLSASDTLLNMLACALIAVSVYVTVFAINRLHRIAPVWQEYAWPRHQDPEPFREPKAIEVLLQNVVWYGANVMDDKPHQFWLRLKQCAEFLGDRDAASTFDEYYLHGDPNTEALQAWLSLRKITTLSAAALRTRVLAFYTDARKPGDFEIERQLRDDVLAEYRAWRATWDHGVDAVPAT